MATARRSGPGADPGARSLMLLVVVGVAAMHGFGLLIAGCAGHGQGGSTDHVATAMAGGGVHAPGSAAAPAVGVPAPVSDQRAGSAPQTAQRSMPGMGTLTACHVLHLCLAVLAGVTLLLWARTTGRFGEIPAMAADATRWVARARAPPGPRWGPLELCVCRT